MLDLDSADDPRPRQPAGAADRRAGPTQDDLAVLRPARRVPAGERVLLTRAEPTVTLTRVQSGIGALSIELIVAAGDAERRLGCAYELESGESSVVVSSGGERNAPPGSRRPVLVGSSDATERIALDLRQLAQLRRLAVYAVADSAAALPWAGLVRLSTLGGSRIEIPLETLPAGPAAVLATVHQLGGELVVRAEFGPVVASPREVARAFGFERIAWLDERRVAL